MLPKKTPLPYKQKQATPQSLPRGTIITMRIVSLLPGATEILWALGLGDFVVAVSHECDYPPEARTRQRVVRTQVDPKNHSRAIDYQVRQLIAEKKPLFLIDLDHLRELQPDIIVCQAVCEVCAVSPKEVLPLQKVLPGAKLVLLKATSLNGVMEDILHVAESTGVPKKGAQLIKCLHDSIRVVSKAVAGRERPRVVCVEWLDPPYVAGHWTPEMVAIAGGSDILGKPGTPSWRTTWEHIAESDPDKVVLMPCRFSLYSAWTRVNELKDQPAFYNLRALRKGHVYVVDANAHFSRPGPRLIEGLKTLAGLLHPESGFIPIARPVHRHDLSHSPMFAVIKTPTSPTLRVFYDDTCPLCIRSAHLARQWVNVPCEFIGLTSPEAQAQDYGDQLTVEATYPTEKKKFQGEQAWLTLLSYGPSHLRLLSKILRAPPFRWLLAFAYRLIAKRRHLWHTR